MSITEGGFPHWISRVTAKVLALDHLKLFACSKCEMFLFSVITPDVVIFGVTSRIRPVVPFT